MKTVVCFCFVCALFFSCSTREKKIRAALSGENAGKITILSTRPVTSTAPDSLQLIRAGDDVRFYGDLYTSRLHSGVDTTWIPDSLQSARTRYAAASAEYPGPGESGYLFCRYAVNGDTLAAILDNRLRVVWN